MTPGIYSLASSVTARWRKQESHAINLAGASTIGPKRQVAAFGAFHQRALNNVQNKSHPSETAAPVSARSSTFDWSNGRQKQTGETLDFATQGPGFFQVQTPASGQQGGAAGTARTFLTCDGHFKLDANNQLVTTQGYRVLGQNGPITLASRNVTAGKDGALNVNGASAGRMSGQGSWAVIAASQSVSPKQFVDCVTQRLLQYFAREPGVEASFETVLSPPGGPQPGTQSFRVRVLQDHCKVAEALVTLKLRLSARVVMAATALRAGDALSERNTAVSRKELSAGAWAAACGEMVRVLLAVGEGEVLAQASGLREARIGE